MKPFVAGIADARKRMERFQAGLERVSRHAMRFGLALAAGIGLAVRAYAKQERAENDLATALRATGQEVDANMRRFKELAAGIQKVTTYADEDILSFQAYATHLGVTADKLDETTRTALGLSKALGMDLQTSMRYTALALQGEFTMLQRYIPELRATESATEKLAIVMRKGAQGFQAAQADTKTLAGGLAQLKNTLGDTAEKIGEAFLPELKAATEQMQKFAESAGEWASMNKGLIVGTAKLALGLAGVAIVAPKILAAAMAIKALGLAATATAGLWLGLGAAVGIVSWKIGRFLRYAAGFTDWSKELARERARAARIDKEAVRAAERHAAAVKRQADALFGQGRALLEAGRSIEEVARALEELDRSGVATDRAVERLRKLQEAAAAVKRAMSDWGEELLPARPVERLEDMLSGMAGGDREKMAEEMTRMPGLRKAWKAIWEEQRTHSTTWVKTVVEGVRQYREEMGEAQTQILAAEMVRHAQALINQKGEREKADEERARKADEAQRKAEEAARRKQQMTNDLAKGYLAFQQQREDGEKRAEEQLAARWRGQMGQFRGVKDAWRRIQTATLSVERPKAAEAMKSPTEWAKEQLAEQKAMKDGINKLVKLFEAAGIVPAVVGA